MNSNNFFGYQNDGYRFTLFGVDHILPILVLFTLILVLYLFRNKLSTFKYERTFCYYFGALIIFNQMAYTYDNIYIGFASIKKDLPLSLCGASMILCGFLLFIKSKTLFSILYYWVLCGATQAILLPSAIANSTYGHYGPDKFRYYQFWFGHISIILIILYMIFVHKYKITLKGTITSFVSLIIFGILVIIINNILGSNYLFIQNPKETGLSFFPPYPYSIFAYCVLAIIFYGIAYLPWIRLNKRNN